MPTVEATPDRRMRRPGRPRATEDRKQREKHLEVATYRYVHRLSIAEVAAIHEISRRTVIYWCALALSYHCERADAIRSIVKRIALSN